MKRIETIQFKKHDLFREQTIDLVNPSTKAPYSTIILIGENGCGKTRLINYIYEQLANRSSFNMGLTEIESIITLAVSNIDIEAMPNAQGIIPIIDEIKVSKSRVSSGIDFITSAGEIYNKVVRNESRLFNYAPGAIISNVDINYYSSREVDKVTNETLDSPSKGHYGDEAALEIEQLIVDIANQDNQLLASYAKKNRGVAVPDEVFEKLLMNRFTNAYEKMFGQNLVFKGVNNNTEIQFSKNDRAFNIRSLSSGEKQIIYRTAALLRNIGNRHDVPVFIDEPEISMHPKWEKRIYSYYRDLFTLKESKSQLFIATHSDCVIDCALKDPDALILSMMDGVVEPISESDFVLPTTTVAEINYMIFGIPTIDYHIQLFNHISKKYASRDSVKKTDEFLEMNNAPKRQTEYRDTVYNTLPAAVRNKIHHGNEVIEEKDLAKSIGSMVEIIRAHMRKDGIRK